MDLASLSDAWAVTVGGSDRLPELSPEQTYTGPLPASLPGASDQVAAGFCFETREAIGEGGQGVVYRVSQRLFERDVAVKVPRGGDEASFRSFMAEAVVTGRLEHPGIVPVHALGVRDNGEVFLAMRLLKGAPWKQRLADGLGQLDHLETLIQVGNAVAYAHSQNIVHCDLKPSNIMVGDYGEVYVLDWGLAVSTGTPDASSWLTHRDQIVSPRGTPAYIAPELALGKGAELGPWTDVYLLGAILFEIVTGRPPHAGRSLVEALMHVASGRNPKLPEQTPPELARICRDALARKPAERPPDAAAFVAQLKDYLRHRESYLLSQRARQELAACQSPTGAQDGKQRVLLYERLAETVARFRQALELSADNRDARGGEAEARALYARTALEQGDLGLAEAQAAQLATAEALQLRSQIARARATLLAEQRQRRRLRRALVASLLVVIAALTLGGVLVARSEAAAALELRTRLARELEAEALAGGMRRAAQRAQLERSVSLDPERFTAWRSLGALALADQDWAAALWALEQARRLESNEQEALYLEALALQGDGQLERASLSFSRLLAEDYRSEQVRRRQAQVCWRLGRISEARSLLHAILLKTPSDTQALRLRIACLGGTPAYRSLEEDRWSLLAVDPTDGTVLAELVRARLERLDVAGLDDLWRELHRRLSSGQEPFFRIQTGQSEALQSQLTDEHPTTVRVRAALSLALFPSPGSRSALASTSEAAGNSPVLREAAQATLLIVAPPDLMRWAERAAQVDQAEGAAQALTLFEQVPGQLFAQPGLLEVLLYARGPVLRGATAMWAARAAIEDPGLAGQAHTALAMLADDPVPWVRRTAALASHAVGLLGAGEGTLEPQAVLLAWRLAAASARGPESLDGAARALLDRGIEQAPSAPLLRERAAWFLARRLEPPARADLEEALRLDPLAHDSQLLALQLRMRTGAGLDELAPLADADPAAARELEQRAAFEAQTGFPALPGPGGSAVLAFDFRQEGRPPLRIAALDRAFDGTLPDARLEPDGLVVEHHSYLRSRFALSEVDRVQVRGPARMHVMVDATLRDSRLGYALFLRNRGIEMRLDDEVSAYTPAPAELTQTELQFDRQGVQLFGDGHPLLTLASAARNRRGTGRFSVGVIRQPDEGGGQLAFLQVQGRLSERTYPREPSAAGALQPLDGSLPLVGGPIPLQTSVPQDLDGLRKQGVELRATGVWQARRNQPQLVGVADVFGDLEIRGRLIFSPAATQSAGLAVRAQVGDRATVRFGIREVPDKPGTTRRTLELNSQRSDRWDVPQFAANWASDTICLVLRREGEFIRGSFGADFSSLQETGSPFYFPMDGGVELCLFARAWEEGEAASARFELVDMAGERE